MKTSERISNIGIFTVKPFNYYDYLHRIKQCNYKVYFKIMGCVICKQFN